MNSKHVLYCVFNLTINLSRFFSFLSIYTSKKFWGVTCFCLNLHGYKCNHSANLPYTSEWNIVPLSMSRFYVKITICCLREVQTGKVWTTYSLYMWLIAYCLTKWKKLKSDWCDEIKKQFLQVNPTTITDL